MITPHPEPLIPLSLPQYICTPLLQPHLEFSNVKDFDRLRQLAVSQERDRQPEEIDRWQ